MIRFSAIARLLGCCSLCLLTAAGRASEPIDVLPETDRRDAVPTPSEFFGFPMGSRHLRHDQMVAYLRAVAEASDRVTLLPYATSHGRRPLMVAAVTSPENGQRFDEIRQQRRRLTSGKDHPVAAESLLVMYLGYSIHGDEASAMNAAPIVAYHLASSESDQIRGWLDSSVFLIDPALNPDGIDRFANWSNENRGRYASDRSVDREHNQPWPGGRTNYYWFDLNRDWLPLTHPESRGRIRLFHRWKPNVVLDFHEMGGTHSYFFQPGIPERNNPLTPKRNFELTRRIAAEHARSMDQATELFFTEEQYDDFYAGKGSTYPDLHGAIGILFEQGSTRGLKLKNERTDRNFADTVANQVRTSLSSLKAAADLKSQLLKYQRRFYSDALRSGRSGGPVAYVLTGEATRVTAAAELLRRHDVQCTIPKEVVRLAGRVHPAGTALVVPLAQPEATFARSLMEPRQDFQENVFYDVSTWHLPSAFDLQLQTVDHDLPDAWTGGGRNTSQGDSEPVGDAAFAPRQEVAGYAIDPRPLKSPRAIARLHRIEADVRVATESFEIGSGPEKTVWPAGTYVVLRQPNHRRWDRVLRMLAKSAQRDGVIAQPLESSMTAAGPDLGSGSLLRIPTCRPLLVVGPGTQAYTAGALWHHLDVRMGQPATVVDTSDFRRADLHEFTCVILPAGSYSSWGDSEATKLRRYVQGGGTVIAVSSAARWLDRRELISVAEEDREDGAEQSDQTADDSNRKKRKSRKRTAPRFGKASDRAALENIAGAFFATRIDPTHPLAFGFPDDHVPVFRDHTRRFPLPDNPYQTAARYEGVLAGYVSGRNRDRLRDTAAVWADSLGGGRVIVLADNPVFRGYVRSTERFLSNAMLIGPELDIPAPPVERDDGGRR